MEESQRIAELEKENAELKRQLEIRLIVSRFPHERLGGIVKSKDDIQRFITYESDWVLMDVWLPIAVIFSLISFLISIYVGFFH